MKRLYLPENKFARLLVNVLFIAVWFYITFLICEKLGIDVPLFIGWSLLLVPIFVYTRYLWFEKSRKRIFFGLLDKFKKLKKLEPRIYTNTSNADELKKYSELKDQGIITEEEFQAKKKKLLDL